MLVFSSNVHAPQRLLVAALAVALLLAAFPLAAPVRAVSPDIVVSQVYGGGGNSGATLTNDFIELFNRGTAAVDVSDWSVQYAASGGNSWQRTNLTGVIQPGQYYLVQEAQGSGGTQPLPPPDATGTIPMSATSGKVALVTNQTLLTCGNAAAGLCLPSAGIRDFVGFGSAASEYEGSGPTATLSNTTAALRGDGGCTDTDDNAADFGPGAVSPAPRNSASAPNPCDPNAPTDPTGVGAADPASVEAGDTTLLTVTVTPGTNPDSTGISVTGDLSDIGGSASQAFLDDGSGGDATSGDGVFSFEAIVDAGTEPGAKSLPVEIADAQGRDSSTSITLTVQDEPVQIWEIQGASHISPLNGDQVFGVDGIVTAVSAIGFWMTDPVSDDDDATSDGIFVFRGSAGSKPLVGDHVTVDGTVSEFRPGGSNTANLTTTQIGGATFNVESGGNSLPVTVVGDGGRVPPPEIIDDDSTGSVEDPDAVYDPENDGIDFYESLEGMYLQVNDAVAVGPTNGFGEIAVVADGGANAGPRTARGGIYISPDDFNPERIILDDVIQPTPLVNTGDTFTSAITGVLDYSFGNFKLLVTTQLERVDNGLQREVTAPAGNQDLTAATFNVENLSNQDPQEKFDELAGMIVHNLRSPHVLGIEEIQDDSGFANDGTVGADQTWTRLIDAIAAAGGPKYEYRQIDPVDLADGGAPGGNIRVGFLFRKSGGLQFIDRPGGTSVNDTQPVDGRAGRGNPRADLQLSFSPGRIGTDDQAFLETRKSLAGEFRFRGDTFFVIVNHFSSKGGDNPLFGRWQPPVRFTEFADPSPAADTDGWRWGQAQVINDFVDDMLAIDPEANVIVLGDINDFQFSDTVDILTGVSADVGTREVAPTGEPSVLTTLMDLLPENEQYSYVFDGNAQVLDQILVSDRILDRGPTYDVVHVNSEFFDQASDHEPQVMAVDLKARGRGR